MNSTGNQIKHRILILMPGMLRGGTEISLLNFLAVLDYDKYDVTLLLLEKTGELLDAIPSQIHVEVVHFESARYISLARQRIPVPWYYRQIAKVCIKTGWFSLAPYGYKEALRHCSVSEVNYDLAIDYHGYSSFCTPLLVDKVRAKCKARVIHGDNMHGMKSLSHWLAGLDAILDVSEACRYVVCQTFPNLQANHYLFPNVLDYATIRKRSTEAIPLDKKEMKGLVLCTVGRMEYEKGYDIVVQAAKILKDRKLQFTWVFVGDGSERKNIEKSIEANSLNEQFILVGMKDNPYPYMRMADLYVQPSRNEGYGLAIEEAQAVGTPVIASNLPAIKEHVSDGICGKLVIPEPNAFAEWIATCIETPELLQRWHRNLDGQLSRKHEQTINTIKSVIDCLTGE